MYGVGERRWEIQVDQPQPLLIALYVRDAAGLTATGEPALPPADPAVPQHAFPDLNTEVAAEQWSAWWAALLAGSADFNDLLSPDFSGLSSMPQLRRVVAGCFDEAVAWAWERTAEHQTRMPDGAIESAAVHELQVRRGRTVASFTLRVTELPVSPGDGWWLTDDHVIVSSSLRSDPDAYRDWLIPVLDAVA